jgi:hypothetical protein
MGVRDEMVQEILEVGQVVVVVVLVVLELMEHLEQGVLVETEQYLQFQEHQ